jgi:pimeloyl-ACP methyl ester carboxylesterase
VVTPAEVSVPGKSGFSWTSIVVGLAFLGVLGLAGLVALKAFLVEWRVFHPPRGPVPRPASAPRELAELGFLSQDGTPMRAWTLPSRNGAVIVFVHGSEGNRASLLAEALTLWRHGFGALLVDLPGHGDSAGTPHWDDDARAALRATLAEAGRLPGVTVVGAFGFSLGGYPLGQMVPDEKRIAAMALAAAPADALAVVRWQAGRWGWLAEWPTRFVDWLYDSRAEPLPLRQLARWPGPVLLVWGERDVVVPRTEPESIVAAGGGPRRLWVVPGAGHGGYAEADPEGFEREVVGFFTETLLGRSTRD